MHPILIDLGFFQLHSYGLLVSLGLLAGYFIFRSETTRKGIDRESATNALFVWVIVAIAVARF